MQDKWTSEGGSRSGPLCKEAAERKTKSSASKQHTAECSGTSEATQSQCGQRDGTKKDHAGGIRGVHLSLPKQTLSLHLLLSTENTASLSDLEEHVNTENCNTRRTSVWYSLMCLCNNLLCFCHNTNLSCCVLTIGQIIHMFIKTQWLSVCFF